MWYFQPSPKHSTRLKAEHSHGASSRLSPVTLLLKCHVIRTGLPEASTDWEFRPGALQMEACKAPAGENRVLGSATPSPRTPTGTKYLFNSRTQDRHLQSEHQQH